MDYLSAWHIVTLNLEHLALMQEDSTYREILESADLIIPDGESIVILEFLTKLFDTSSIDMEVQLTKYAGIDLACELIARIPKIVFWGAKLEVNTKLRDFVAKTSSAVIDESFYFQHGFYYENEEAALVEKINLEKPDLFLVALGNPRQDLFINKYKDKFPETTFIGVGGSFDIWSGSLKRAPEFIIKAKLEWLFRIIQEPHRISSLLKSLTSIFCKALL